MTNDIKELREQTGMTQKAFSEAYRIPLSTLRKWEQYESTPPKYLIRLLARSLPQNNNALEEVKAPKGALYYCDTNRKAVYDSLGNCIFIKEDLSGVKRQNLGLYLQDLFEGLYVLQDKFNEDCKFDKQEDIIWR